MTTHEQEFDYHIQKTCFHQVIHGNVQAWIFPMIKSSKEELEKQIDIPCILRNTLTFCYQYVIAFRTHNWHILWAQK